MDTFTRRFILVISEIIVTALFGTLMGPVIGGTLGHALGYWSGIVGPVAVLVLGFGVFRIVWQRTRLDRA